MTTLVFCESGKGQSESINPRLIQVARDSEKTLSEKVVCALFGDEKAANTLSEFVDETHFFDSIQPGSYSPEIYAQVAIDLIKDVEPQIILLGNTFFGMDLASRLSSRLGLGIATNCTDVIAENGSIHFLRPIFGNKLQSKVIMNSTPAIATIQSAAADPKKAGKKGSVQRITKEYAPAQRVRHLRLLEPTATTNDISKSEVIVAGGRGIGEKANFALIEELAQALGGVPAASRPLVDMGWVERDRQVGMSGKTVKPKLYIACGISGAMEHLMGMKESATIVAINKDRNAPIFGVAHYGVVGDLIEILPQMISEAKARKK